MTDTDSIAAVKLTVVPMTQVVATTRTTWIGVFEVPAYTYRFVNRSASS